LSWLFDTNALSELSARKINVGFRSWYERARVSGPIFTSSIAIGELYRGALFIEEHDIRRSRLLNWISKAVLPAFEKRIIAVDEGVARTWAEISTSLPRGIFVGPEDALIAATAVHYNLTLVTRDVRDMARFNRLLIENPWSQY
jgi:toxin FitB